MSVKLLAGVTHALVTVPAREDADRTGVRAIVDLCYGPGDDTAIGQIYLSKNIDGEMAWNVPHTQMLYKGQCINKPVFRGELLVMLCAAAAKAVDHIRTELGKPEYGKRYRVYSGGNGKAKVEEDIAA